MPPKLIYPAVRPNNSYFIHYYYVRTYASPTEVQAARPLGAPQLPVPEEQASKKVSVSLFACSFARSLFVCWLLKVTVPTISQPSRYYGYRYVQ